MINRIYTQDDFNKITNLYNSYLNKKNSYSPEQQWKIESAFGNARKTVQDNIAESKNSIADMRGDEQGNTWVMYGDGRKRIVKNGEIQKEQEDEDVYNTSKSTKPDKKIITPEQNQSHGSATDKPPMSTFQYQWTPPGNIFNKGNIFTTGYNKNGGVQKLNGSGTISDYIVNKSQADFNAKMKQGWGTGTSSQTKKKF